MSLAQLVFAQGAFLLIIGRAIQGFSAALIMLATIALIKDFYEDEERQRALSFWSIGSWGSSGICSFAGGAITTYMGWRWINKEPLLVAAKSVAQVVCHYFEIED